jgi:hypothetical protein
VNSNASELVRRAEHLGLRLERRPNGKLAVISSTGVLPAEFIEELRPVKSDVLDLLDARTCPGWGTVPPDNLRLQRTKPHPDAEDRELVLGYLLRQGAGRPCPLAAWLMRREEAYFNGLGAKWDCGLLAYAAARDAACWQLDRDEADVLELLRSFREVVNYKMKNREP